MGHSTVDFTINWACFIASTDTMQMSNSGYSRPKKSAANGNKH